jgi:hypothetical protein
MIVICIVYHGYLREKKEEMRQKWNQQKEMWERRL